MMKYAGIVLTAVAVLAVCTAGVQQAAAADFVSLDYSVAEAAIGGWDYAYTGDGDSNGTGTPGQDSTGKFDGTFVGGSRNDWDGSVPGSIGSPLGTGDAPGGYDSYTESGVTYLRMQDAWDPEDWSTVSTQNWPDPGSSKFFVAHNTEQDVTGSGVFGSSPFPGAIMHHGMTLTFRARIASTGTLDDAYMEAGAGTAAWDTTNGQGPKISGSSTGMVNVCEAGYYNLAFTLLTSDDVKEYVSSETTLGGGLYMNNDAGIGSGTSDLQGGNESYANYVPIDDEDLLDWTEFWITIEESGTSYSLIRTVTVYMNGSTTPAGSFTDVKQGTTDAGSDYAASSVSYGTGGGTAYGATDLDFFGFKLRTPDGGGGFDSGAHVPVIPEPTTLGLMLLGGLAMVGLRRRR